MSGSHATSRRKTIKDLPDGHNPQTLSINEDDYPFGNTRRYDEQSNEKKFSHSPGRAYDREQDYSREHDEDNPFINQNPEKFYDRKQGYNREGDERGRFTSDDDNRYFRGDQGYYTRQKQLKGGAPPKVKKRS